MLTPCYRTLGAVVTVSWNENGRRVAAHCWTDLQALCDEADRGDANDPESTG